MKRNKLSLIILMALTMVVFLAGCGDEKDKGPFNKGTTESSAKTIMKHKDPEYLAYFYQPTCIHCQAFKPTLEKYIGLEKALPVYAVNLADESNRAGWKDFNVQGTPTLFHVKDGKVVGQLVGEQSLESIPTKK